MKKDIKSIVRVEVVSSESEKVMYEFSRMMLTSNEYEALSYGVALWHLHKDEFLFPCFPLFSVSLYSSDEHRFVPVIRRASNLKSYGVSK